MKPPHTPPTAIASEYHLHHANTKDKHLSKTSIEKHPQSDNIVHKVESDVGTVLFLSQETVPVQTTSNDSLFFLEVVLLNHLHYHVNGIISSDGVWNLQNLNRMP
jgi:hypothetical protein